MNKQSISKFIALCIVLLCLVAALMLVKSTKTVKIFLLAGQSNMAGAGDAAKLKPPYSNPLTKVKIWQYSAKNWEPLEVVKKEEKFGPEISLGPAIEEIFPDEDIRLVKYAESGTALYDDWSPKTKGPQYVKFMATLKAALANLDSAGEKYEMAGMMWLQGESDAEENKAETYQKNLTEFIAHIRTQLKTPKMPFIIARVRNYYGGQTGQAKIVRDAQVEVAGAVENVEWFDTDDCSMINAGHYDTAGLIEVGKRFADEYMKIVKKAKKR